jgi:Mn2+/Fe2+ NRAMP family transporter
VAQKKRSRSDDYSGPADSKPEREPNLIKQFFLELGPGLITGASDDDPSGIGTYTTAGATLGFATLWTAILTLPMMAAVQFICAKLGLVSGRIGGSPAQTLSALVGLKRHRSPRCREHH